MWSSRSVYSECCGIRKVLLRVTGMHMAGAEHLQTYLEQNVPPFQE